MSEKNITPKKQGISQKIEAFNSLDSHDKWTTVGNWLLDHAMIIIIILLVILLN